MALRWVSRVTSRIIIFINDEAAVFGIFSGLTGNGNGGELAPDLIYEVDLAVAISLWVIAIMVKDGSSEGWVRRLTTPMASFDGSSSVGSVIEVNMLLL